MSEFQDLSPVQGVYFSFLEANGIRHRVASNRRHLHLKTKREFPLVFLLHGFCDLLEGLGQTSKGLTKIKIVLSFSTTFQG